MLVRTVNEAECRVRQMVIRWTYRE